MDRLKNKFQYTGFKYGLDLVLVYFTKTRYSEHA